MDASSASVRVLLEERFDLSIFILGYINMLVYLEFLSYLTSLLSLCLFV